MSPTFFGKIPSHLFTPPGIVNASPAALAMARAFIAKAKRENPDQDWVASFDWADSRRVRNPRPGGPREDLGAGLDLGAYERRQLPAGVTTIVDSVEFAVRIDRTIYEKAPLRLIDVDENVKTKLILR